MTATDAPRLVDGRYVQGERVYPRVSQVLEVVNKPGLNRWRERMGSDEADRVSREATTLGTAIHAALEVVNRGAHPPLSDPRLTPFIQAYAGWFRRHVADVLAVEQTVWSERYRYAGTYDVLVQLRDTRIALIDLKSSNSVSESYFMQLAAYAAAHEERTGQAVDTRLIVRLPSREPGALYVTECADYPGDWRAFRAALALYRWLDRNCDAWKQKGQPFGKAVR